MRDPKAWIDQQFLTGTNISLSAICDAAAQHRACKAEGAAVLVLKGLQVRGEGEVTQQPEQTLTQMEIE